MQQTSSISSQTKETSPVFGLRYLEENEADILEVAGCQGIVATEPSDDEAAITYKLCGDGWDSTNS